MKSDMQKAHERSHGINDWKTVVFGMLFIIFSISFIISIFAFIMYLARAL